MAKLLEERVPRFLDNLEKSLKANDKSEEWVVSDKMTYADVVLFQFIRGYRSSAKEHWESNNDIPLIKAHTARMEALPAVKAFLESDRCTKMEEGWPYAEAPNIATEGFM